MPEIAEVARVVHHIRRHLVGKTLSKVVAVDDANVYGKVGTSGSQVQKALGGKKIVGAGQQGKYFWLVMDKPPHPLMHFGMTGWLKIKGEDTYYYKKKQAEEEGEEWPPRFWKFHLETKEESKEEPKVEAAFVDPRRLGRVRLLDCAAEDIRRVSPLKENGPDPVIDHDLVTVDWLMELCRKKKIPIKALLLDQANISGIGNWVGDEIMYHARMHPEQYSNTLSDEQIKQLHKSIHYICNTAVDLLADSDQFPKDWLFKYRWSKGKRDTPNAMPNGEKITFLTVGGRTSAVVPSVQKKTGPVAKEMSEGESGSEVDDKKPRAKRAKTGTKRKIQGEEPKDAALNGQAEVVDDKKPRAKRAKTGTKRKIQDEEFAKDAALNGQAEEVDGSAMDTAPVKPSRKSKRKEDLADGIEAEAGARSKTRSSKKKSTAPLEALNGSDGEPEVSSNSKKPAAKRARTNIINGSVAASEGTRRSGRLGTGTAGKIAV